MSTGYDITIRDRISASIVRKLNDIAKGATAATTALTGLDGVVNTTTTALNNLNSIVGKNSLRTFSNSASGASRSIQTLAQRLVSAQSQAAKFNTAITNVNGLNTAATAAINALNSVASKNVFRPISSGANNASTSVKKLSGDVQTLTQRFVLGQGQAAKFTAALQSGFTQIRSLLSGALLLGAADRIVEQIDAYRNLQNRLRTVTDSEKQLTVTSDKLFEVAQRARSPIAALSESYTRFDRAIVKSGGSQKESLRLTETVSKLLTLSGSSAAEAGASMLQLSQAFNKGKLDGDEFRSVAELMPKVIDEVTKVLGISSNQIYKWSRDGKISTEVLRQAFANLAEKVDADMAKLPRSIGQAFTQFSNEVVKFFGEIDTKFKISDTIIGFLDSLKNNLPEVFRLLTSLGAGFLAAAGPVLLMYAAMNPLTTLLATFPGIVGAGVAYLTYFGDEIKVTSDGVVTFTDVLVTAFSAIKQFATNNFSELFNLGGASGAQLVVDFLIDKLQTLRTVVSQVLGNLAGMSAAFAQLFNNITVDNKAVNVFQQLFVEALSNMQIAVQQTVLDIAIFIVETFSDVGVQLYNILISPFEKLRETLNESLPTFMGGGSLSRSLNLEEGALDKNIILNTLKEKKAGLKRSSPALDSVSDAYALAFNGLTEKVMEFENGWLELARKNAAERAQFETKRLDAQTNPDSALRGEDTAKQALIAQQQELLKFNVALDKVINKSEYLRTVLTKKDPDGQNTYTKEFQQQLLQRQPELQGFNQEIVKLGLGMKEASSATQQAATSLNQFGQTGTAALAETPNKVKEIGPAFQEAGKNSKSFFEDMKVGIESLNQQIQQLQQAAKEALQEIGSGLMDGLKGKDGKFDSEAFLKKALPAGAKLLSGKINSKRASDMANAIKESAPQDQQSSGIGAILGGNKSAGNPILDIGNVGKQASQSIQELTSAITAVQGAISGISASFEQVGQSAATFSQTITTSLQSIQESVPSITSSISSEFSNAFATATSASASMASSVIANMQAIESAARSAASATSSVGGSRLGGGGGGLGFGLFASGGYTGDMPTNRPVGIVHGQEFVVPADATAKYRPMLEAMRAGRSINVGAVPTVVGSSGGGGINVQIDNYGNSQFEVQQLSASEIRIIAREESRRVVRKETGAIVANGITNPNSQVSKSLGNSTQTLRRRT